MGRTCVAAHAKLWLVRPLGFRVDDYYLRRAGLDYWERLEWDVVDDWQALTAALPTERKWLFTKQAERSFWDVEFQPRRRAGLWLANRRGCLTRCTNCMPTRWSASPPARTCAA